MSTKENKNQKKQDHGETGKTNVQPVTEGKKKRRRNRRRNRNPQKNDKNLTPKPDVHKMARMLGNPRRRAQGVRQNIMVQATLNPLALECLPAAIMARAITFQLNTPNTPIYWAYYAFMLDLINMVTAEVVPVSARLRYLNQILPSWRPKTVPFKTGTLSYAWKNGNSITISNVLTVRNYKTYWWVAGGADWNGYLTQVAPPNPSTNADAFDALAAVYTTLGSDEGDCLKYEKVSETTEYSRDVSAYGAIANYYGTGNISGTGPAYSVENEVPYKSRILACTSILNSDDGRVARKFSLSSGDSTSAAGLPFIPSFKMDFFKTAYPVQYKFLDLDEVVVVLQLWYLKLVAQSMKNRGNNVYSSQEDFALAPFTNVSAQKFRIAVRQAVLSFFAASCPATQFINYTVDNNGFEPFRCGSNTAPNNIQEMVLPSILVENLRMLLPAYGFIPTKYQQPRNAQIFLPVWGIYKSREYEPYNAYGTLWEEYQGGLISSNTSLFSIDSSSDPSPIDGSGPSGECVDLNSPTVNQVIAQWNSRVRALSAVSVPQTVLAGSSPVTLLTTNRYSSYLADVEVPLKDVPAYLKRNIPSQYVKVVKRKSINLKLTTTKQAPTEELEQYYVPPTFSLITQITRGYSSMQLITEELRQLFNYFIFPTIAITPNQSPSQRAVRVAVLESDILDFNTDAGSPFSNRYTDLEAFAALMAPGLANNGQLDDLVKIISSLNTKSKGGFLGDLLTGVASVVLPMIPI